MKKKLVLFSAGAVVIACGLIYVLGVYPPASTRDAQGAIGQREVYRDPQAHDAAVTPGSAPVAASTISAADTKRIEEASTKLAAGFVANVKTDFRGDLQTQLIALLAHADMQPAVRAEMASDLSQQFSDQFIAAMQQQLVSALRANFMQAAMAGSLKYEMSAAMQQHIASEAAAGFQSNVTSQLSSALYNQFKVEFVKADMSAGFVRQFSSNLANELAPKMANQFSSSLAQNMIAQFSSGLTER